MDYCTSPTCYLFRARAQLDIGTEASLFYAALELRFGVEMRLREYLEAYPGKRAKKSRVHYRVAKMGALLDKVFQGDRAARIIISSQEVNDPAVLFFTPVTKKLRRNVGRLGDYLHSPKSAATDEYFAAFRCLLEDVYSDFKLAASGTLMGPPLLEKGTRTMRVTWQLPSDASDRLAKTIGKIGAKAHIDVRYLDEMTPEEVELALHSTHGARDSC